MLLSIGVDVGSKNGAIAIINENLKVLELMKAPYYITEIKSKKKKNLVLNKETGKYEVAYRERSWTDFKALGDIYKPYIKKSNKIIYTVERVSVRPGEGETSSFIFGDSLGIHRGQYSLLQPIAYYEPRPNDWKKVMGVTSNKETSIELAQDIFKVNLKDFVKKKSDKVDDIAESLLLAFYGMQEYFKEIEET